MMTMHATHASDQFHDLLEKLHAAQAESGGPLQKLRSRAWERYQELGLPSIKSEVFRYLTMRKLYAKNYGRAEAIDLPSETISRALLPECMNSALVFVNGHFLPALSRTGSLPKKAVIIPLEEASKTFGTLLNNHWAKSLKEETDPFAVLNAALHQSGAFIYIPPKTVVESPIQIIQMVASDDKKMAIMPRVQIFVGSQSQVNICQTQFALSGDGFWVNSSVDFAIEDGSQVQFTQALHGRPQNIWEFEAVRATLKRDSLFKSICITDGSETIRSDYRIALTGENGEASLNKVWMLSGKREAHSHVVIDHQAPHCRSMQLFKGVLNDQSRSSFEGKILVRQQAQKTEAFQLNNNLLMSERAMADSKPNLEIFADDVKASHGATVGQLDKEELFYMKTRGFSDREAKNLLIHGFCREVIDMIPFSSLHREVCSKSQSYLLKGDSL